MRQMIVLFLFMYTIISFPQIGQSNESLPISAQHAIVMDVQTGRTIYEKNAHVKREIASITKVLTAIIAIEYGDLQAKVTVSKRAIQTEGSSIYLHENEQITLEDLLYGLMLRSGNDAAIAIAEHIGGSVEGFAYLMNEKAAYLGMTNSSFKNPHGLDEEGHYSTAYDIALLMRYAMQNETFQKISSTHAYLSKNRSYKWFNKNKLLTKLYPHTTGGKTGYTKKAGRTLVTTAEKNNQSLITVTLNASNDWNDHIYLYEKFFKELKTVFVERKGKKVFQTLDDIEIAGNVSNDVFLTLRPEEIPLLKKQIVLLKKQDASQVGEIQYQINDETVYVTPLYTSKYKFRLFMEDLTDSLRLILRGK